ncbi:MAG TPA: hypothetical protein EYP04_08355 [Anaerolineae bacterium]|nr:hypothetical protein [Anaerolineae bacterium]
MLLITLLLTVLGFQWRTFRSEIRCVLNALSAVVIGYLAVAALAWVLGSGVIWLVESGRLPMAIVTSGPATQLVQANNTGALRVTSGPAVVTLALIVGVISGVVVRLRCAS